MLLRPIFWLHPKYPYFEEIIVSLKDNCFSGDWGGGGNLVNFSLKVPLLKKCSNVVTKSTPIWVRCLGVLTQRPLLFLLVPSYRMPHGSHECEPYTHIDFILDSPSRDLSVAVLLYRGNSVLFA